MKKYIISSLLVVLILLSLSSCAKSEEAQAVDDIIANIGIVSLESGDEKIVAAEAAVEALSGKDKKGLDYLNQLRDKRREYNDLLIKKVEDEISAIGQVTVDSGKMIEKARNEYEALPDNLQKNILNFNVLESAEEEFESAMRKLFDSSVSEIEEAIANIGTVSLESGKDIIAARKIYDKAESDVKGAVSNYNVLTAAEEQFAELESILKIENTEAAIDAIGNVTLQNSSAVDAATKQYDSLSNTEKKLVKNENKLKSAQTTLKKLQDQEADRKAQEAKKAAVEKARNTIQISRLWISSHDSAGGVELYINYTNKSPKTIKYLTFGASFYNSVGDIIKTWRVSQIEYCQDVGPFYTGQGRSGTQWYWGKYYDWSIQTVKLSYLQIEYTDGTTWTASADDLKSIQY